MAKPNGTTPEPAPDHDAEPMDQGEYAALLVSDTLRNFYFAVIPHCDRCGGDGTEVSIEHPIWGWSGPLPFADVPTPTAAVDVRRIAWCSRCDGPRPAPTGRPVRVPYIHRWPIRLLPALYARPPFHRLGIPVELYVAPPQRPSQEAT